MSAIVKQKNPNAVKEIYAQLGKKATKEVAVGFPAGKAQAYPNGTPVATVAAIHVFGMGVPQRDFMGLAIDGIKVKTQPILKAAMQADDPDKLLNAAGLAAQAEIQRAIIDLQDPPNADSTIEAKRSSNPLIDTAHMKNSVTYVVRKK